MQEAILSVLRHLLTIAGTYAVSKGFVDGGMAEQLVGAVTTIVAVGWGAAAKLKTPATPAPPQ